MKDKRILIVEDESLSKSALVQILQGYGYEEIAWITKGAEAIQYLKDNAVDLIFMDITLEGNLDGIETAGLIDTKIPVIFVSSSKDPETFNRIAGTNSYGFIQKPITPQIVQDAIYNAFA